jgi:putative ABC transport system permease protein
VGATRGQLLLAYGLEYLLIGFAAALFGVAAGTLAAALVIVEVMNLPFIWLPGLAATAALAAIAATVVLGLAGTFTVLGQKPAPVLRAL